MGNARWDADDWKSYSTTTAKKTQSQIFTQTSTHQTLNTAAITVREALDSAANPQATPIIIGVDHTGSMGVLAETIIKHGLGTIMQEIYDRKPVPDPQIMVMAVGDAYCDQSALQATQFEGSMALADQVEKLHIEHGGGGNGGESYALVWYFAANKTKCSAIIDRHRKGYLFTIGDEPPHMTLERDHIKRFAGDDVEKDIQVKDLLGVVSQNWEVFHLVVNPGAYPLNRWKDMLHERVIEVSDHTKLAEVIVSTIQVIEGADVDQVTKSWSGDTSLVVHNAIGGLVKGHAAQGAVRL